MTFVSVKVTLFMTQIISYLTFNGNCRDAMLFYQACFGGELSLQTVGESPMADQLPAAMKDTILHGVLTSGNLTLMASDMVGENGLSCGNNISLMLQCYSESEIKRLYDQLSVGGKATHPLENTFWGALFGDLTDKYGNQWLLHFDKRTLNSVEQF